MVAITLNLPIRPITFKGWLNICDHILPAAIAPSLPASPSITKSSAKLSKALYVSSPNILLNDLGLYPSKVLRKDPAFCALSRTVSSTTFIIS